VTYNRSNTALPVEHTKEKSQGAVSSQVLLLEELDDEHTDSSTADVDGVWLMPEAIPYSPRGAPQTGLFSW
jgi:hypothetical protein